MARKRTEPPKWSLQFFRWFCKPDIMEDVEGDLWERFNNTKSRRSYQSAAREFSWQVLLLFRPGIVRNLQVFRLQNSSIMFKHNLRIGWRMLVRNRWFSLINMGGLALGMAIAMLIIFWIADEMGFDKFHRDGGRVFKVMRHVHSGDEIQTRDRVTWNIADALRTTYSQVEDVTVMADASQVVFSKDDFTAREGGYYAGPEFFRMFSWELLAGDRENVLSDPTSIVISESMALRYFGEDRIGVEEVIGKTIDHNIGDLGPLKVSGVFMDCPKQSSLQFDFVLPVQIFESRNSWIANWMNSGPFIYVRMKEGVDWNTVSRDIVDMQNDQIEGFRSDLFLQPYIDQHLYSSFRDGVQAGGRIQYVRIFGVIAFMIILIACINFMNLSTARSMNRIKEIGIRKTVGAGKRLLINQFMGESFLLIGLSFLLACFLVVMALPSMQLVTGKDFFIGDMQPSMWLLFVGVGLVTALIASIYPALYLSSFSIVRIFRSSFIQGGKHHSFRQGLVIFQFAMSFLLIVGTLTVYRQIKYIHTKNLGLDREQVIVMPLEGAMRTQYEVVKSELLHEPGFAAVSSASEIPINIGSSTHQVTWEGKDPNSEISFKILSVDYDFIRTLKMQLAEGSDFDPSLRSEADRYLINQRAAEILSFDQTLGKQLKFWGGEGNIVGVVKDFHMSSLYSEIEPAILWLRPGSTRRLFARTAPGETELALASLAKIQKQFNPEYPLDYSFLDESFEEQYRSEQSIMRLSFWFTAFALFIAALGLLGLAIFLGQQRIKEVSVRKILGASIGQIVYLLSKDFLLLILISFSIAAPIAYLFKESWLNNFVYKVEVGLGVFLIAAIMTISIAMVIVGSYAVKVALLNPMRSLRNE